MFLKLILRCSALLVFLVVNNVDVKKHIRLQTGVKEILGRGLEARGEVLDSRKLRHMKEDGDKYLLG